MNPPFVYTTNYDEAIEEAAKLLRREYKKVVNLKDVVESPHGIKQIIKFHGDFNDKDSIVFTRKDYDNRLQIEKHPLDILFRSHILGKSVLFLGYGFGDENIKLIFNTHTELYGTKHTLPSYIISFKHDPKFEASLRAKNVITLVLESPDELSHLIEEIGSQVFSKSVDMQFRDMFKPFPSQVMTDFELDYLEKFINSADNIPKQKHDKFRESVEGKTIASDVEDRLSKLMEELIQGDYCEEIKEAVMLSFPHTQIRQFKNVFKIGIELMRLTDNPKFVIDLDNHWTTDVIMMVEHKYSNSFENSEETRKWMCNTILVYLQGMRGENKTLTSKQVGRLLDGLRDYGYKEFGDLNKTFTKEVIEEVIEYYLSIHGPALRSRFQRKSMFGRPRTATEIMEEMIRSIPKSLLEE
jgi:hypothetical protein